MLPARKTKPQAATVRYWFECIWFLKEIKETDLLNVASPKVVPDVWPGSTLRGSTATSCRSLRGTWSSWRPTLDRTGPGDRWAPQSAFSLWTLSRSLKIYLHLNSWRSPTKWPRPQNLLRWDIYVNSEGGSFAAPHVVPVLVFVLPVAPSFLQAGLEWVVALYDFAGNSGDLSFQEGDHIQISRHIDSGWSCGRLDGREGIFPRAFVESAGMTFPPVVCWGDRNTSKSWYKDSF